MLTSTTKPKLVEISDYNLSDVNLVLMLVEFCYKYKKCGNLQSVLGPGNICKFEFCQILWMNCAKELNTFF